MNAERDEAVLGAFVLSMMGQFQEHFSGGAHIKRRRRLKRTRKTKNYIFFLGRKERGSEAGFSSGPTKKPMWRKCVNGVTR
jgi:hypothetical protein